MVAKKKTKVPITKGGASAWQGLETSGAAPAYRALRSQTSATKQQAAMIAKKHKKPSEAVKRYKAGK